jgi:vacuolar protein sorting-associated protein 29
LFLNIHSYIPIHINHSTLTAEVTPSFILLAIQGSKVVTYVYELHGDQVDVSKSEFSKA